MVREVEVGVVFVFGGRRVGSSCMSFCATALLGGAIPALSLELWTSASPSERGGEGESVLQGLSDSTTTQRGRDAEWHAQSSRLEDCPRPRASSSPPPL